MKIIRRICCVIVSLCLLTSGCRSFDKQVPVSSAEEKSKEGQTVTATTAASNRHSSSYKHVLVSVVDDKSGKPISGAAVSVGYLNSENQEKVITDENGRAMLKVNCSPGFEVFSYNVEIANNDYDEHIGVGEYLKDLPTRSESLIPTQPDVVLELTSRVNENRANQLAAEKEKADDEAAEKLFRDSPNFWPEQKDDPYSWVANDVGEKLLSKRWERASRKELGTRRDVDAIRAAVVQHMRNAKSQVSEIRWLSPTIVMVKSSWYEGPLASAGYTYALKKTAAGWTVIAYYMDYVS